MPSGGAKTRRGGCRIAVGNGILAVGGNTVITAEAHTELGQLCETFPGIAVCVEPESVEALVARIRPGLLLPKHNTVARGNMPNARSIKRTCYVNL